MVDFRPHLIRFRTASGGGFNEYGEPVPAAESWSDPVPCRYENNTETNVYRNEDGTFKVFRYAVWLDGSGTDYTGRRVRLYGADGSLTGEGTVHHCPHRQFNTLLYVE
jgi:hypothetical protein